MEEGRFKSIIFGLILFTLFAWLILSISIQSGEEYGIDAQEIGNGSLSSISYESSIENVGSTANSYRTSFESGEVDDIDDASGMFSTLTKMINFITTPFTLVGQILDTMFGIPSVVTNVFLGLLALSLIFGAWRVLRSGS